MKSVKIHSLNKTETVIQAYKRTFFLVYIYIHSICKERQENYLYRCQGKEIQKGADPEVHGITIRRRVYIFYKRKQFIY